MYPGEGEPSKIVYRVRNNKDALKRWNWCRVLIIDEISMLSAELFDKLDFVAREVRGIDKPFGGVQLLLSGDFHQLPPVCTSLYIASNSCSRIFSCRSTVFVYRNRCR